MTEKDVQRIADDRIVNFLSQCVAFDDIGNMSIWKQAYEKWLIKTSSGETQEGDEE